MCIKYYNIKHSVVWDEIICLTIVIIYDNLKERRQLKAKRYMDDYKRRSQDE